MISWDQVVAWQVRCQCGWTGTQLPAHDNPTHDTRDCPDDIGDAVFAAAWDAHIAPYTALADLGELTDQLRELELRTAAAVRLARAGGASWTQVGRAAGLSKQGAHQRWGQA